MPKRIDYHQAREKLSLFYRKRKRLPSFSELGSLLGYRSKGGVAKLIRRLQEKAIVEKDPTGRLIPTALLTQGTKLLGYVQAGFPSPAEEELIDTISLDEFLIQKPEATYLVKVNGDSMIDAGIHPQDLVLVEKGKNPKHGDVVVAQVDGEWTMKFYLKKGRRIILRAANKKYSDISPSEELVLGGVVTACIRKYAK